MRLPLSETVEAYIALGSNLGDSASVIRQAFLRLQEFSAAPIRCSSLWRSSPMDCPPGSPDFINAAVALVPLPGETPETLLQKLQSLERTFGRKSKVILNEPRPLDLDLIAFGAEVRRTPELTLPHPRACLRPFVLLPLSELAPALILPGRQKTVDEMRLRLPATPSVERI